MAERGIETRHLRRMWGLPTTTLGLTRWPPGLTDRLRLRWSYWWQAQLLDCLVDAQMRAPTQTRWTRIANLTRSIRLRNLGSWTNEYYDDMAWLGLALARAGKEIGLRRPDALNVIVAQLRDAWSDHGGGGIWWRRDDDFKNAPANGPTAILFTRLAADGGDPTDLRRAEAIVDWMEQHLLDRETGLIFDGLHVTESGEVREVERTVYTYCQGVFLGACMELARVHGTPQWLDRAERTVTAVATHLTTIGGVLRGQGGGDGGLFAGILARYLTQAAIMLVSLAPDRTALASRAAELVYNSAEALWKNRTVAPGGPLFGPDFNQPALTPGTLGARAELPERDLSVQLGGWMVMEAAAQLERSGDFPRPLHRR
ncbi:putative alpha-1,6-mannanase, GH76 family [Goodfellowiella coeruleoviolacea]|uniref:Alpha-1,6-mannanase, GH76 family n=1 Tax=Goodfellowiella coeruleoviolacea TaxID=334858 RepID=A0AAE3GF50_9PSEU|nr:putative alpha-1,6-mannanase, GH76 family [Goodfellowiella coeruleoviolacea]